MSLIPYSTDGGQTSKYYLQVSGDSTLIPSTTTKLEIEFPAEFELAPNALTCTNKFGFSSNPTCSVVRQNVIEIQTSAMLFPFTTYLEIDVDPLKNPIVESGPFQIKLAAVRSPDPVPRHHADSQQHLQQRRLFYHASADHREDADLQGLRRLRLHRRLVQAQSDLQDLQRLGNPRRDPDAQRSDSCLQHDGAGGLRGEQQHQRR